MTTKPGNSDKKRQRPKSGGKHPGNTPAGGQSVTPAPPPPGATGLAGWFSRPFRAAATVFALSFLLYANTLGHDFVWDDRDLIVDNSAVATLDGDTVTRIFREDFWAGQPGGGYYRPLVTLSYHVQYQVFDGSPAGFHLVNVLWNALVCALVFAFVYLLFGNPAFGLAASLIFAVHPVHTENVAWVAGRTDVLSTLWAMVSLVFYTLARLRTRRARYARYARWLWLAGALAAFFLSLLAKESSAFLPLVIVILEAGPFERLRNASKRSWLRPALYFAVFALYLIQRHAVLGAFGSTYDAYAPGALGAIALPLSILGGYALKLIFPFQLSGEYDAPIPTSFAGLHVIAGLAVLAAVIYGAVRYRRRPDVVLGAGIFLFGFGPVANLIPIGEISAERFLYFPSLGFALVAGGFISSAMVARSIAWREAARDGYVAWPGMKPSLAGNLVFLFVVVLAVFGARTVMRNADWKNEEILFAKTVQATPTSARAHLNVGNVARRQGRLAEAVAAYNRSLRIDPGYPDALSNLAGIHASQGRIDEALPLILRALEKAPDDITLLNNLGSIYFQKSRFSDAAQLFEQSLEIDPQQPVAHYNLGLIRFEEGKPNASRRHFERVAGRGPQFVRSWYYLAVLEDERGNVDTASQLASKFLSEYNRDDNFSRRARELASKQ